VPDPKLDLDKLKAIKDWSQDLVDELNRSDVLPCKNVNRVGDCISRQRNKLVEEMAPTKMCTRCQAKWHVALAHKLIEHVYCAKTELRIEEPTYS
jgi:hypothetical protein